MRTFIKIIISIILLVIGGAFGVSGVKILTLLFGFIVVLIWSYKPNKKTVENQKVEEEPKRDEIVWIRKPITEKKEIQSPIKMNKKIIPTTIE